MCVCNGLLQTSNDVERKTCLVRHLKFPLIAAQHFYSEDLTYRITEIIQRSHFALNTLSHSCTYLNLETGRLEMAIRFRTHI